MRPLHTRAGRTVAWTLGGLVLAAVALAMGGLVPIAPLVPAAVAVLILALGITAAEPVAIPLLATPLLLVVQRANLGAADLSVSDLALAAATLAALVFTTRPFSRELRSLLWLNVAYQAATLFTVVLNPFTSNTVEWFHAWMLVSGSLLMGWTIGRAGYAHVGLTLLVVTAVLLAVITLGHAVAQYARGDFGAVYLTWPFGMHKNYVGTVMAFAATIVYVRPDWMRWRPGPAFACFWLFGAALMTTQSRQAVVGLGIAILFTAWRMRSMDDRRSRLIALAVLPALAVVAVMVRDQIEEGNQFNSAFQRLTWYEDALAYWQESLWFGHGLRFWYRGGPIAYQPPNALLEVGTSAGVVGLIGFFILLVGAVVVLWRIDPHYGTVALAMLLARIVQSQLDLFWAAVQASVPFFVAGVALGALALHQRRERLARSVAIPRPAVLPTRTARVVEEGS